MTTPVSTAELLRKALDAHSLDIHTALPGIVRSYDAANQTAEIELALTRNVPAVEEDEAADTFETLPILPSVPVVFPRAGGFYLHFPLAVGDSVLVVFSEQDMNSWRNSAALSDPSVGLRHGLSGGVAIPGLYPRTNPNPDASASSGTIGTEGGVAIELRSGSIAVDGDSDSAALASRVKQLETAFNAHVHTSAGSGSPSTPPTVTSSITFDSSVLKVGS